MPRIYGVLFCKFMIIYPSYDKYGGVKNVCRRKAAVVAYTSSEKHQNRWNEEKIVITLHRQSDKTTFFDLLKQIKGKDLSTQGAYFISSALTDQSRANNLNKKKIKK